MGEIDLTKCKTIDDMINAVNADVCIYDESPEDDDGSYTNQLNPYLTDTEIDDAKFWYPRSRGVGLISGEPGAGKGVLLNMIGYKMRWYFNKTILMDYMPRRAFAQEWMPQACDILTGLPTMPAILVREIPYIPFGKKQFVEQLSRMSNVAMGDLLGEDDEDLKDEEENQIVKVNKAAEQKRVSAIQHATGEWLSTKGNVFLKYAVLKIDEAKKYHNKRTGTHNPMTNMLMMLYQVYRHLDLLVLLATAHRDDLDTIQFMPKVTYEIKANWAISRKYTTVGNLVTYAQATSDGVQRVVGKNIPLPTDGAMPREVLGNYTLTTLIEDIDEKATVIGIKDCGTLKKERGTLWIEREYIGYESMQPDIDEATGEVLHYWLTKCVRALNKQDNKCKAAPHLKGALVYGGKGWFNIFHSQNAIAFDPPKSLQ